MPFITLTSDLGLKDHYAASIKGAILSRTPGAVLVDISHNVSNYNIVQAAYIFKHCWQNFPPGALPHQPQRPGRRFPALFAAGP